MKKLFILFALFACVACNDSMEDLTPSFQTGQKRSSPTNYTDFLEGEGIQFFVDYDQMWNDLEDKHDVVKDDHDGFQCDNYYCFSIYYTKNFDVVLNNLRKAGVKDLHWFRTSNQKDYCAIYVPYPRYKIMEHNKHV